MAAVVVGGVAAVVVGGGAAVVGGVAAADLLSRACPLMLCACDLCEVIAGQLCHLLERK